MVRHIRVRQLSRLLLHHAAHTRFADEFRVRETEAAELQSFGVVGGVGHDGADGRAEPVADVGVGAVGEGEGLEGGAAGAYCFGLVGLGSGGWWRSLRDSTGVRRADSLMKLSRRGRPVPVRSKSAYWVWHSLRRGSTYSGCRQRSWMAKVTV